MNWNENDTVDDNQGTTANANGNEETMNSDINENTISSDDARLAHEQAQGTVSSDDARLDEEPGGDMLTDDKGLNLDDDDSFDDLDDETAPEPTVGGDEESEDDLASPEYDEDRTE